LTKTKDYKHLTKKMSEVSKFEFYNDISLSNKEYTIGIALALTMGWCGVHRFWLGDSKGGLIYLIFFWTLLPFIFSIVDAICMKRTCKKINNDHAVDAFKKYSEASLPI
jgi:TM2 domain-containing membrane protein YozV